jgi:hypothetical protein
MSTLILAFITLTIAVLLGTTLALFYLGIVRWRSTMVGAVHGVLGAMGLGMLAFALKGPARGVVHGVDSFGKYAAIAAALALVGGCVFVLLPVLSRRGTNWLIGGHAILGIAAYVLLLTYVALG